uniref:Serine carboxypeptitase-like protein 1 n=1 Tax=Diospyros kaki TaxID=35925 RepID=A4PB66_DIOKA|nr:serine carboxypeptitase-like protein 1 [Diospyros kaki]
MAMAASPSIVKFLPGFDGELPFKLETGYIGVGEIDEVQLFYYFVESQGDPSNDPLILWLTGGPGCSGFSALVYEIGPLLFKVQSWKPGTLPSLRASKNSWTKVANIIFIDQPVGTGFSYGTTAAAYNSSDTVAAAQVYKFLRKWLMYNPKFGANPLYVGGDLYSGITVPLLVQTILDGIGSGSLPRMQLKGYLLGNPLTDDFIDANSKIPYAFRVNLLSDELYEDAEVSCNGDFVNVDFNNTNCVAVLQGIKENLQLLNEAQNFGPLCALAKPKGEGIQWGAEEAEFTDSLILQDIIPQLTCRSSSWMLSYIYMNDEGVQRALGVKEGTMNSTWRRCAKSLPFYEEDVSSTVAYHKNFTRTALRALIYSGDQALSIPYLGTLEWINSLGVPIFDTWRPWFVDGQVAGYTQKYEKNSYSLTFATVKGAGETAPEYKRKEALAMVNRWFAGYPV